MYDFQGFFKIVLYFMFLLRRKCNCILSKTKLINQTDVYMLYFLSIMEKATIWGLVDTSVSLTSHV